MNIADRNNQELLKEVAHWKRVASYLSSCHAATLESLPKSASKSSRERHVSICKKAANMLRGKEMPPSYYAYQNEEIIEKDIKRCEKSANAYAYRQV